MNTVDQILDSMSPTELAAFEGELDKRAEDASVQHYFDHGVALAQESVEALKEGKTTPAMHLMKEAAGIKSLSPEDQAKFKANKKNPPGPAGGPGHGSEKKSGEDVEAFLEKASTEELAAFEAELDTKLAAQREQKCANFYFNEGVKLAREVMSKEAKKGLISALSTAKERFVSGMKGVVGKGSGKGTTSYRTGKWVAENPGKAAIGAGTAAVGAGAVGTKILD